MFSFCSCGKIFTMFTLILIKFVVISLAFHHSVSKHLNHSEHPMKSFFGAPLHTNVTEAIFGEHYEFKVNSTIEYTFQYLNASQWLNNRTARISVESKSATKNFPVLVVVRQQKGILSWQLPLIVGAHDTEYRKVSRTLCPSKYYRSSSSIYRANEEESVIVSISSSSPVDVSFNLSVFLIDDFYLSLSKNKSITVSPSQPHFYAFDFPNKTDTVLLRVNSNDDICTTVSVQTIDCPIFDLERNVQFEGQWETMYSKGGMTLKRDSFRNGLYIVFVVKGDNSECIGHIEDGALQKERNKTLSFMLLPDISLKDYLIAISGAFLIFFMFYIFSFGVMVYYACIKRHEPLESGILNSTIDDDVDPDAEPGMNDADVSAIPQERRTSLTKSDSSLDEDDIDVLNDIERDKDIYRTKRTLRVCDLARKNHRALQMKSMQYLWSLITVGVFYALPVVQLVVTYQTVLNQTGNLDLCYYNFRCSHPLGLLSDFNHVFSNIGYVTLGLLFTLITARRERRYRKQHSCAHPYGIPQHFGLFYAMGAALMMEGVLSASYHVCPNHSNFQFDTSFMYVIAVLCMVKIYQNRHPDINARAYATFAALAGVTFIGMWGVIGPSPYFWVGFTILHIVTCLIMSAQIYYMTRWTIDIKAFKRVFLSWFHEFRHRPLQSVTPRYPSRMVLLVLGNICNWVLASYGIMHNFADFATYLLIIFMANLILYCTFYIVMKLCYKEKILGQPLVYIGLSIIAWGAALFYFFQKSISWKLTPAQSRTYNQQCLIGEFYDKHDVWHFLSASSMFFSFMVLLTLDDDLIHTSRDNIAVF